MRRALTDCVAGLPHCAPSGVARSLSANRQTRVSTDIDAPWCPWDVDHHSNSRRNTMLVEAQVTINGSKSAI